MNAQQVRTPREARDRRFRMVALGSLVCALIAGTLAFTVPAVAETGTGTSDRDSEAESSAAEQTTVESTLMERLNAALEPLVTSGTITAEQRDAIVEALLSARRELRATSTHASHHGWRADGFSVPMAGGDDLLGLLGLERAGLRARLRAGETLAEVAESVGVEVAAVVDLLVESAGRRVDVAVEAGRLDEENRDACVAALEAHVTARVNGDQPGDDGGVSSCGGGGSEWRHGRSGGGDSSKHWGRIGRGRRAH